MQQTTDIPELKIIPADKTVGLPKVAVKAHNEKRALHGCPAVGYSDELAQLSKQWAEILIKRNSFEHRPDNSYGENIYMRGGTNAITDEQAVENAVQNWYNEIKDYKFFNQEPSVQQVTTGNPTGHFTQLVWKSTTCIGVGIAKGDQNKVVVVANYAPAGNVIRFFKDNVPPPKKK